MKTLAMIISRLGSTRLPEKALLPILGKPMIRHLVERVKRARSVDGVMIATTTLPSDDRLEALADSMGCLCFRGSPDNVSQRVADAAASSGCETVVEILADNPLVHSEMIDDVLSLYRQNRSDYAANATKEYSHLPAALPRFPIGIRVQAYRSEAARRWKDFPEFLTKDLGTTAFLFANADRFRCDYLEAKGKWAGLHKPDYHFAVNYQKNFDLIEKIFSDLYAQDPNFSLQRVISWMEAHPEARPLMG